MVASRRVACIIAAGEWGGSRCLLKNRDRNYKPDLKVYHEVIDGVEVLYIKDELTGWIEGINEYGIGIVNSALAVDWDETEKKKVKNKGMKSKDGERILKALGCDDIEDAVEVACTYKTGVKGHSFVANPELAYTIESTRKHEHATKKIQPSRTHVRTNHGFVYTDAGYTDGPDLESSVKRKEKAEKILRGKLSGPDALGPALYGERLKDLSHPNNMVRDTDNMRTTSQLVLNLSDREALLYLIPGKVSYKGYVSKLPKGHEPKIKLRVYKYTDIDGDGDFDVVEVEEAGKTAAERVAARWLGRP